MESGLGFHQRPNIAHFAHEYCTGSTGHHTSQYEQVGDYCSEETTGYFIVDVHQLLFAMFLTSIVFTFSICYKWSEIVELEQIYL